MLRRPDVCHWTRYATIFFVVLASHSGRGTTVVIYRDSTRIVVGADTLRHFVKPSRGSESYSFCKIKKTRTIYVSMAGLTADLPNFDAYRLASRAITHSNGVVESAKQFAKLSTGPFTEEVNYIRRNDPIEYRTQIMGGRRGALQAFFMSFENSVPRFATVEFIISETSPETISVKPNLDFCPGHACPPARLGLATRVLGIGDAIYRDAKEHPSLLTDFQNDPVSTIRRLIELETREEPDLVGLPIDILTISKDGATWNQRGVCH
jgi:hypothetical protein